MNLLRKLTHLLSITDTVVSRAGSNAIYEFLTLRIPMLLIPLGLDRSRGIKLTMLNILNPKDMEK